MSVSEGISDGAAYSPFDPTALPATGGYYKKLPPTPCTYDTVPLPIEAVDGHPVVCKNRACKYYRKSDKVEYKSGPRAYRCEECMTWTD
ncbi:hypothetical protein ACFZBU_36840 [Embleya sp. NPDC008237]|uniref:hypothetical protein n=1 Tax=unclassified Embleya TaxID=2699296 RepID=UPI0036E92A73